MGNQNSTEGGSWTGEVGCDAMFNFAEAVFDFSEEELKADLDVRIFDILMKKRFPEEKTHQRYCILLPGRIVFSDKLKSPLAALSDVLKNEPKSSNEMLITPNMTIRFIDPQTLRLWNPIHYEMESVAEKRTDEINHDEIDSSDNLVLYFSSEEDAKTWEKELITERDRVYLQEIAVVNKPFAKRIHQLMFDTHASKISPDLRNLYFHSGRVDGPGLIVYRMYRIFATIVSSAAVTSTHPYFNETVAAFVAAMEILASDRAAMMIFLALKMPADVLEALTTFTPAVSGEPVLDSPEPVKALAFLALVKYVHEKVSSEEWLLNRSTASNVLTFPLEEAVYSLKTCAWFKTVLNRKGKFMKGFYISWAQLHQFLEATPYCGYYFVEHYVDINEPRRARGLLSLFKYSMQKPFIAIFSRSNDKFNAAHFISYLEWDSIQRGYEEFEIKNAGAGEMLKSYISAARSLYNTQLVSTVLLHHETISPSDILSLCIKQLRESLSNMQLPPDIHMLTQICAEWMEFTSKKHLTVAAPGKSQMVALLIAVCWVRSLEAMRDSSTGGDVAPHLLVGEVSLGADKALINAMIGVYLSKLLRKRVHILYHSEAIMTADYERLKEFLAAFGIKTSFNDFMANADVTYCLSKELCQYYRASIFVGTNPLSNAILLVDDVNELCIDKNPNVVYGKRDEDLTKPLRDYFDLLEKQGEDAPAPEFGEEDRFKETSWIKAQQAYTSFLTMEEGKPNGYTVHQNRYELIDENGQISLGSYFPGLIFARFKFSKEMPTVNSKSYFQSRPHMLRQYAGIFALGTKGASDSTRSVLHALFGSLSFEIPNDEFQKNYMANAIFDTGDEVQGVLAAVKEDIVADATPKETHDGAAESSSGDKQDDTASYFSTAVGSSAESSIVSAEVRVGMMMNDLCDRFYLKFPHDSSNQSTFPSDKHHRLLIDFLDSDKEHTDAAIAEFADSLGITLNYHSNYA